MRSRLFHTDWYLAAQRKIKDFFITIRSAGHGGHGL